MQFSLNTLEYPILERLHKLTAPGRLGGTGIYSVEIFGYPCYPSISSFCKDSWNQGGITFWLVCWLEIMKTMTLSGSD